MKARLHHGLAKFTARTRPLLEADPIRHSVALGGAWPAGAGTSYADGPPVLLTVDRDDVVVAAAVCNPPRELIVSGLPADCAGAAAEVLALRYPGLPGAVGPRSEAEPFAQSWTAATGASVHERVAQRVFAV